MAAVVQSTSECREGLESYLLLEDTGKTEVDEDKFVYGWA